MGGQCRELARGGNKSSPPTGPPAADGRTPAKRFRDRRRYPSSRRTYHMRCSLMPETCLGDGARAPDGGAPVGGELAGRGVQFGLIEMGAGASGLEGIG